MKRIFILLLLSIITLSIFVYSMFYHDLNDVLFYTIGIPCGILAVTVFGLIYYPIVFYKEYRTNKTAYIEIIKKVGISLIWIGVSVGLSILLWLPTDDGGFLSGIEILYIGIPGGFTAGVVFGVLDYFVLSRKKKMMLITKIGIFILLVILGSFFMLLFENDFDLSDTVPSLKSFYNL